MKKFVIGLVLLLSAVIVGAIYVYQQSHNPYDRVESETIAFVSERTDLNQAEDFYWYNGTETYLTVQGFTEDNEEKIYIVRQNGGNITEFAAEDTVSRQEAIQLTRQAREPDAILNARIGMVNDTPVWEISYRNQNERLGYYIIHLETGEWLRTIDNI